MTWWSWIIVGLVLLLLELATSGGFFLFFFGASGLLVGILTSLGLLGSESVQWAFFSIFAIVGVVFFRKKLIEILPGRPGRADTDSIVGLQATAGESIAPAAIGKVELRGSSWNARNVGNTRIEVGGLCQVTSVDGLTLSVKSL